MGFTHLPFQYYLASTPNTDIQGSCIMLIRILHLVVCTLNLDLDISLCNRQNFKLQAYVCTITKTFGTRFFKVGQAIEAEQCSKEIMLGTSWLSFRTIHSLNPLTDFIVFR